jgi:hypothetical protein
MGDLFEVSVDSDDTNVYLPWGSKRSTGGMRPYAVVGHGPDDFTLIGGKPIPPEWLEAFERHAHRHQGAGLTGVILPDEDCPVFARHPHTSSSDTAIVSSADPGSLNAQQAPEPATTGLAFLAATTVLARRRRR